MGVGVCSQHKSPHSLLLFLLVSLSLLERFDPGFHCRVFGSL